MPKTFTSYTIPQAPPHDAEHIGRKGRPRLSFTEAEISAIHDAWMSGMSIMAICARFNHGTEQIRALAKVDGWPARGLREPLPAGHPATWGVLIKGTICEGASYQKISTFVGQTL